MTTDFIHGINSVKTYLFSVNQSSSCLILKSGKRGPRLREIEEQARKLGCSIEISDKVQMQVLPGQGHDKRRHQC